jgi:hypothetical protein
MNHTIEINEALKSQAAVLLYLSVCVCMCVCVCVRVCVRENEREREHPYCVGYTTAHHGCS